MNEGDLELTDRERLIAEHAAKLAVKSVMDEFYRGVGKSVVNKLLIVVGCVVVGLAMGKGWLQLPK